MAYVLRFVQRFRARGRDGLHGPRGAVRRPRAAQGVAAGAAAAGPIAGREPGHTLVWECELPTLAAVNAALDAHGVRRPTTHAC